MSENTTTEQKQEAPGKELSAKLKELVKTIEGLTALEISELVKALEDKFGISIPDEDINKIVNLHEAVAYVEKKLEIKDAG